MKHRLTFMVGFGLLGVLPMLQLLILWRFCDAESIGRTLFATTVALFVSAFCDGTSSYRGPAAAAVQDSRIYLLDVLKIRLSRLVLAAPAVAVAILLSGRSATDACAAAVLAAAYVLSFAFVERNFGSVTRALRQEYASRLTCLMLPVAGTAAISARGGLVLGAAGALAIQGAMLFAHARPRYTEVRPTFKAAFSGDLLSGALSLVYVSFAQLATAALLSPGEFARFITIDRIVRAGLLVTEPARLLFLRRSWSSSERLSTASILGGAALVAAAATTAVALLFALGIPRRLFGIEHGPFAYLLVCFLTSVVAFTTLCGFVRFDSLRTVNALLAVGLAAGGIGFWLALSRGPFTAALTFETMVCAVVVIGAVATNFGRYTDRRPVS